MNYDITLGGQFTLATEQSKREYHERYTNEVLWPSIEQGFQKLKEQGFQCIGFDFEYKNAPPKRIIVTL